MLLQKNYFPYFYLGQIYVGLSRYIPKRPKKALVERCRLLNEYEYFSQF